MKKLLLFCGVCCCILPVCGAVKLPALFSDHAVLARQSSVPLWGKADPGEKVTVSWGKETRSAVAGKDGKWMVRLDLSRAPQGAFEIRVNDRVIRDVLAGEVWLCSGQSNMQFRLRESAEADRELPVKDNMFRCFEVPCKSSRTLCEETGGRWVCAAPENNGRFPAVGWFFGRKLRKELKRPVGLINSSWGGSPISAWIPAAEIESVPQEAKRQKKASATCDAYPGIVKKYLADRAAWEKKYDRADRSHSYPPASAEWKKIGTVRKAGNVPGAFWFRTVADGGKFSGSSVYFYAARQRSPLELWVNGKRVGSHPLERAVQNLPFGCSVPASLLKEKGNEIVIRFFSSCHPPRLTEPLKLGNLVLSDKEWSLYTERALPLSAECKKELPKHPAQQPNSSFLASRLYNAMIHPLRPAALSGVIWYQGEADNARAALYRLLFPALVNSWRKDFKAPKLPFYYCQLPAFRSKQKEPPQKFSWAEIRDAQDSILTLPMTGSAVLIDLGEANDIHPREKQLPGERLAALALHQCYGVPGISCGPRFRSFRQADGKILLSFDNTGSGLEARKLPARYTLVSLRGKYAPLVPHLPQSQLQGFALCGKDGHWVWAAAEVAGNEVIVTPPAGMVSTRLRYAWEDNPTCNLYNREGFPAAPFQCTLSASTENKR